MRLPVLTQGLKTRNCGTENLGECACLYVMSTLFGRNNKSSARCELRAVMRVSKPVNAARQQIARRRSRGWMVVSCKLDSVRCDIAIADMEFVFAGRKRAHRVVSLRSLKRWWVRSLAALEPFVPLVLAGR